MKIFLKTITFLGILSCGMPHPAFAAKVEQMPANPSGNGPTEHCGVSVEFGSYSDGIDKGALNKVSTYIETSTTITTAHQYSWGSEGQQTFCLTMDSSDAETAVYAGIKSLLPAQPAHGNIAVNMGAQSFSVP